ncbi:baculoviral IAP repeat-containing protein 7-A-like [Ostrea edulis]|uniref:baculoviral IAP repeat-containing protein 7-A-like n=1 Tax=Ostrea edulis TaxID=37623 RepID=UPI0024AF0D5D|nr:baculoviral IAP repeat-containing protein 7-A-like [Ostrea edulis]
MTTQLNEEDFIKLRHDSERRLQTFYDHWPATKNYLSKEEFVRQGFYCVGQGDRVRCVYCRGYLSDWEPNDDILLEHKKHFPKCPFIISPYKFPEFRDFSSRLESFSDWPSQFSQRKEDLALAGMFYLGKGDQTKCFWCNGILADWEPGDSPVLEHRKWFKDCQWLEVIKSEPFFVNAEKSNQGKSKTDEFPIQETSSPEDLAKKIGFSSEIISKAAKKCGGTFDVETLVKAILDLGETKTEEVVLSQTDRDLDMKCLKGSTQSFDPSCKICFDASFNTVFLPCGHLLCCEECARTIRTCPMCRATIASAKKVFLQ